MFLITVPGEIIANDKNHYAQNWVAHDIGNLIEDNSYDYNEILHSVRNNLILNKNIRAVPYAVYVSEKGICSQPPGNLLAARGALAAECCYKDNISEIEDLIKVSIPSEIEIYFYNGLLTGIFSVLELFLSDVVLCIIFNNREPYNRALDYIKEKGIHDKLDPDLLIQKYFTKNIVYHKFDTIKPIFKKILHIRIPDTNHIRSYLPMRNNITHRFSFSNYDRMRKTIIDKNTLHNFIGDCDKFVDEIMKEINKVY